MASRDVTLRFRIDQPDGSDPSDLLDDVHEYLVECGYDVLAGEYGPNWFALRLACTTELDEDEFVFALARDLAPGFPHSAMIGAVADDAGRTLYPKPELLFDA
jgi:hypothetical protein